MTSVDFDSTMRLWFRDVEAFMDDERLARHRQSILSLTASSVEPEFLVKAAHGRISVEDLDALEAVIRENAPEYEADRKHNLVSKLSAAAAFSRIAGSEEDATVIALYCQSASFVGWVPAIEDLRGLAEGHLTEASRQARSRLETSGSTRRRRQKPRVEDADVAAVSWGELRKALSERDAELATLQSRIEGLVTNVNRRLDLADEEIDALWWARSSRSATTGAPWTEMSPAERVVLAASEVGRLARFHPVAPALESILLDVVGDPNATATIAEVASSTVRFGLPLGHGADDSGLMPLSLACRVFEESGGESSAVADALSELAISIPEPLAAGDVARQLLNEESLRVLISSE